MPKKRHRFLRSVVVILVILAVLVIALPRLLSTSASRNFIVGKVNEAVPGRIEIRDWSLSWLRGSSVDGLAYFDPQDREQLKVKRTAFGKGLLQLLMNRNDLGTIRIDNPVVTLFLPVQEPEAPKPEEKPGKPRPKKKQKEKQPSAEKPPPAEPVKLPGIKVHVVVNQGTLFTIREGETERLVLKDLDVNANMDVPGHKLTYDVELASGVEAGMASIDGTVTLPHDRLLRPHRLVSDVHASIERWDIAPLFEIASTYTDLPAMRGVLDVSLEASGTLQDGYTIRNDTTLTALSIPDQGLTFGTVRIDVDGEVDKTSARLSRADMVSDFCNITASGNFGKEDGGRLSANADIDLDKTALLLVALNVLSEDMELKGDVKGTLSAVTAGSKISLEQVKFDVRDLVFIDGDKTLREPQISLMAVAEADTAQRTFTMPHASLDSSSVSARVHGIEITDWNTLPASATAYFSTHIDLAKLFDVAGEFIDAPEGTAVAGSFGAAASLQFPEPGVQAAELKVQLTDLEVLSTNLPPIREKEIQLGTELRMFAGEGAIEITSLGIDSAAVELTLEGRYADVDGKKSIAVEGLLAPDLAEVSKYIKAFSDIDIAMEGKGAKPFHFNSTWHTNEPDGLLRNADADLTLAADSIDAFGLEVRSLEVPVRLQGGHADVELQATVNEGTMVLQPHVDFMAEPQAITFPDDSQVLQDVHLTGRMANELLSKFHPLFKGATMIDGRVDLIMSNFYWPLDTNAINDAAFAGRMDFRELSIGTTGMVYKILETMKVSERQMNVGSRDIDFSLENGRITSSPMKIDIDDYRLTLSGSMGLDQTLDYVAEIPVTRELVGRDVYQYFADTTFRVPIRGTASNPELNLNSFSEALGDLAGQAAKKALEEKAGELIKGLFGK